MNGHDPSPRTPEELAQRVRRAESDYLRLCERFVSHAESILRARGRESLPPDLVEWFDAALDAREVWFATMDDFARSRRP